MPAFKTGRIACFDEYSGAYQQTDNKQDCYEPLHPANFVPVIMEQAGRSEKVKGV